MTHKEKIEKMYEELHEKGVSKSNCAPPVYRLLWKLGVEIAPPLFSSFMRNLCFQGTFFAVLWGVLMWFTYWQQQQYPFVIAIIASVTAGFLFGLFMAVYFRYVSNKHGLPSWDDYK